MDARNLDGNHKRVRIDRLPGSLHAHTSFSICGDGELIRKIWKRYDSVEGGSKVFSDLLKTLKRLLSEKPALLGTYTQMGGIGVQHDEGGSVAGRVASATVSGVVGMITSGNHGLSVQNCSMKLQW